ncbi:LysR family transcriptional regulator [Halomonas sp. SpR1]|uniref:LysR family transcriptional regulator n=1 Tax=Halomonas sp. SpR1 TaxID=3050462 RepID=UPI0027E4EE21|nr:LysR family transcriptional regulator [Halomonas sp. SpR1]MDQ7735673.1 LysR family transcriptional regulator [Halomonas sp. SpR1]
MNLRQIRYFCEVVDAGGGSAAAKRLFVAPTAISAQLALLEQTLGGELFDRATRPMQLTSLGKFFYPRAKELLLQASRLEQEAKQVANGSGGWLGVGFIRSALFSLLPSVIKSYREEHPEVHLDLVEVLSEYQEEKLRQHRIDIGISRFIGMFEQHADMHYDVIINDPFMVALPIDHPLAKRDAFSIGAFDQLPFILYPKDTRSPFGQKILNYLEERGVRPAVVHDAIEIHTALALVGAGLGGTLVSGSITANNRSDVVFLPVDDIDISTTLVAVTRKGEMNPLLEGFIHMLISKAEEEIQ